MVGSMVEPLVQQKEHFATQCVTLMAEALLDPMAEPETFAPAPENVVVSEESVPEDVDALDVDALQIDHEHALDHSPDDEGPDDGILAADDLQGADAAVVEAGDHADRQHSVPTGVERRGSRGRSGRTSRNSHRDQGGLRIRLSDNELRAAQVIQDRFKLRSPVAALGFSLRTMAQMIERGELGDQVVPSLPRSSRSGGAGKERERSRGGAARVRANPFARPPKPEAPPPEAEPQPDGEAPAGNADDPPAHSES